jgi:competence protein CoiA
LDLVAWEEIQLGSIRPDLVAHTIEAVALGIELAYTSLCDEDKIAEFAEMRLPALEIDISSFSPEGFEPESFRSFLLMQVRAKTWLWPKQMPEQSQPDLAPDAPIDPPPPVTAITATRLPEEIVTISGRWVSIKQLPSGDIAVRAIRYDPDVVSLVGHPGTFQGGEQATCGPL